MISRRLFLSSGCVATLAACANGPNALENAFTQEAKIPPLPDFYGPIYGEPYPIPAVPKGIVPPHLWRQEVSNPWPQYRYGAIVIDTNAANLHFVLSPETAIRYGVSVGAAGFEWAGDARLQFMRKWPRWNVPLTMVARRPELEPFSVANGGMDPGPGNPMGARALYLFKNGKDTLYRIHGDASPQELGHAVSAGCIRMLNQDVIDLYNRAVHGASVVVLRTVATEETLASLEE